MSQPISVDILSDDDGSENNGVSTPLPIQSKRQKTEPISNPTILVIDDDPTPQKPADPNSSVSFVPETPFSSSVAIVQCNKAIRDPQNFSGVCGLICLESDNESDGGTWEGNLKQNDGIYSDDMRDSELSSGFFRSSYSLVSEVPLSDHENQTERLGDSPLHLSSSEEGIPQVNNSHDVGIDKLVPTEIYSKQASNASTDRPKDVDVASRRKRMTKEDRDLLKEEKKQLREQEKLEKAAKKAEAAELKKLEKERQKWEKGKFALKSIVAEIDTKVVELGSIGGHLLTRFSEKGLTYRITSNPIERSIIWNMAVPDEISQLSSSTTISYVLFTFEAEEFCSLVMNEALMEHVSNVRRHYPTHTICYLTNRLMAFINKREQEKYKNPHNSSSWRRPPVEEVLSKLTTHFARVHSRLCIDESELAEHVVGLTCSLASCQFRKKLTRLSVNANGSLLPKDCSDRNLIKKSLWLKALVAIPKVQPRFALAIWKKYPTMRSLLSVYMDPNKSVHDKEFLLKDLTTEGLLGGDRRLGEVCSKRVYRILTAKSGNTRTDDVEDGADFFSHDLTS